MEYLNNIVKILDQFAPLALQEEYDNAGLLFGDPQSQVSSALLCLDITDDVLDEAVSNDCQLVISHHPLVFRGLKKINTNRQVDRLLVRAIRENIALYAMHTNLDNLSNGVSMALANKLELSECKVLRPLPGKLCKLVTFCPDIHLSDGSYVPDVVRNALFEAGAGFIGKYDSCSFNISGEGSFRGLEGTDPFIGTKGEQTVQKEVRIETILPVFLQEEAVRHLIQAHPYEEVAYDIYPLLNLYNDAGPGIIGTLPVDMKQKEFLLFVKEQLGILCIRHTGCNLPTLNKIALCGGAGSFLIRDAMAQNADAFLTADLKYHDFFETDGKLMLADIGHFESEQFAIDLLYEFVLKNFSTFAILKTKVITNPINYF
jgi:dinuclear metal center YbgI/SA1388 family protein